MSFLSGAFVSDDFDRTKERVYELEIKKGQPIYNMVYKPQFSEGYCKAFVREGHLDIIDFLWEEHKRSEYGVGVDIIKLPVEFAEEDQKPVQGTPGGEKVVVIGKNRLKEHI